jgi:hypothetical protein
MKITRSMFATAALGLLVAFCAGGPSMALGGYGSRGEDVGGVGGYEGHEGGLGVGAPLLDQGGRGGIDGEDFRLGRDGYAPRVGLPSAGSDYDNADDYNDDYCGRAYPSYNAFTDTYVDPEGRQQHCP